MKRIFGTLLVILLASSCAYAALPSMVISDGKTITMKANGPLDVAIDGITSTYRIGAITAATTADASDTLTIAEFAGLDTTIYTASALSPAAGNYVLYVESVDLEDGDTVFVGTWRPIRSVSSTGVVVVSPGFDVYNSTAELDVGDEVSIRHRIDIMPDISRYYHGFALSGGSGTAIFPDLIGRPYAIQIGAAVYCVKDQSATTNDSATAWVTAFDASIGQVTFAPAHTAAVNDEYVISFDPITRALDWGAAGYPVAVTGAFPAINVSDREAMQFLADSLRRINTLLGTSSDSAGQATLWGQTLGAARNAGTLSTTSIQTLTAGNDSLLCFTVTGEVYVTDLNLVITTAVANTLDSAYFLIGGTRITFAADIKNAAAGAVFAVDGVATKVVMVGAAAGAGITAFTTGPYRFVLTNGAKIYLTDGGGATAASGAFRANMKWYPGQGGGSVAVN